MSAEMKWCLCGHAKEMHSDRWCKTAVTPPAARNPEYCGCTGFVPKSAPSRTPRLFSMAEIEAAVRAANESPDDGLDLNEWQDLFWAALEAKP